MIMTQNILSITNGLFTEVAPGTYSVRAENADCKELLRLQLFRIANKKLLRQRSLHMQIVKIQVLTVSNKKQSFYTLIDSEGNDTAEAIDENRTFDSLSAGNYAVIVNYTYCNATSEIVTVALRTRLRKLQPSLLLMRIVIVQPELLLLGITIAN